MEHLPPNPSIVGHLSGWDLEHLYRLYAHGPKAPLRDDPFTQCFLCEGTGKFPSTLKSGVMRVILFGTSVHVPISGSLKTL